MKVIRVTDILPSKGIPVFNKDGQAYVSFCGLGLLRFMSMGEPESTLVGWKMSGDYVYLEEGQHVRQDRHQAGS